MTRAFHRHCGDVATPRARPPRGRRGLSLLEVLVSMFVLLFGLLGVAALFPLGQFNVSRASRYDRAAAIGQAAFNEIKVRGLLQPTQWIAHTTTPPGPGPTVPMRVQFDPLATKSKANLRMVTLPGLIPSANPSNSAAWHVFVSRDDLKTELPANRNLPAVQLFNTSRSYDGHYSWMFTVSPSESASDLLLVSVAVFHRRNPDNEETCGTSAPIGGQSGGSVTFSPITRVQADRIKPGTWVLIAQQTPGGALPTNYQPYFRWFRVESFQFRPQQISPPSPDTGIIQLAGPQWDTVNGSASPLTITYFDSVVAVYEKLIRVEAPSAWSW